MDVACPFRGGCARVVWQCPDCTEAMDPKFQRTHQRICRLSSLIEEREVERLLDDLGMSS
jgi:hypothetical protein